MHTLVVQFKIIQNSTEVVLYYASKDLKALCLFSDILYFYTLLRIETHNKSSNLTVKRVYQNKLFPKSLVV